MDCLIQQLKIGDSEGISPLVGRAMSDPWTSAQLEDALSAAGARAVVANLPEAGPVGFVFARRIADFLEVDLVGVDPERRREGIAAHLLGSLLDEERQQGMQEARLELAASNASALALYEKLGFVVVGRRARYYPDGDDALLLSLHVS
ncbi:MAG: GNAT family N-acetyltransferase [Myxococcota bacterium]